MAWATLFPFRRIFYNFVMNEKPIDRLESRLESLIEGMFTRLFLRVVCARDIAILLLRAMEDGAAAPSHGDSRPIAPDSYTVLLRPEVLPSLLQEDPDLTKKMSDLIVDFAEESGYKLLSSPSARFLASDDLDGHGVRVYGEHHFAAKGDTEVSAAVSDANPLQNELQSFLLVDGKETYALVKTVINIGRESDNDIVLNDGYVSRHHLQLRRLNGRYTLFDVHSRGGTRVNNIVLREHKLQEGDQIQIGETRMLFANRSDLDRFGGTTQVFVPDQDKL